MTANVFTRDDVHAIVKAALTEVGELAAMIPGVDHEAFTTDELIESSTDACMAGLAREGESCA